MKEKILITSALLYANGPLHFGHIAGAYLPADCYARFQRMQDNDVLFISGSDEYGIAITMSAELAGRSPREHVDLFHEVNTELFRKLDIAFDHYSRTTWPGHIAPVQSYFTQLLENGYIEERVTNQLYSEVDGKFLADRYVVGTCPKCSFQQARGDECPQCGASYETTDLINPRSKLTNSALQLRPTKHWFLLLDKFKDRLTEWLKAKNWKSNVVNFVQGYIDNLHARAITRDMTWGVSIPLPDTDGKVLYVWFDAPIGYISASMEWAQSMEQPDRWKDYWLDPQTKLVHFIGKDNIPFHAVIFPAMTMGQNMPYKLVDELPANEFLNLEGRQFSKSDGWYIDLDDFFTRYTADQIRYALAANAPENGDSEFTWKDFQLRCNTDLLGKFGNLVNRTLVFAKNQCEGKVPAMQNLSEADSLFLDQIKQKALEAEECYRTFKIRKASQLIMELAQLGNIYFDSKKPWHSIKQQETRYDAENTIACCLECLKILALIAYPIIPGSATKVWKLLGNRSELENTNWQIITNTALPAGQMLPEPQILFGKVEDDQIAREIETLHSLSSKANKPKNYVPLKEAIDIDLMRQVDLRVGQVLSAKAVPKSKKLLHLEVDLGFEKRSVVSGIAQSIKPETLIGKKLILVANLKPATLMGIQSQGMILAAEWDNNLELPGITDLPPGSIVS